MAPIPPLRLALLLLASLLPAQQAPPPAPPTQASESGGDVVVTGRRDIDATGITTSRQMNSLRTGSAGASRQNFAESERFARCAVKAGLKDVELLRRALDGVANSVRQDAAQRRFVQINANCAPDGTFARTAVGEVVNRGGPSSSVSESPLQEQQFYYDRGALFVQAVRVFAADTTLTTAQTGDPAVQARFIAREQAPARLRLPADARYFGAAVCLVQHQPGLATRLVVRDLSPTVRENIAAQIVNTTRQCFGGAKHVYFAAVQMRFYLADALYRWIVAARGVASLVPDR